MIRQPTFLVGSERSGTTMFRLMLDHHPQIAWASEFIYAVEMLPEGDGWPSMEAYQRYLEASRLFGESAFQVDPRLDYPALVDSFLCQQRDRRSKQIVGATVHYQFDRLLRIWPDARFIHLVRDGRDVTRSCIVMGWASNTWTGADRWIAAERLWESFRATLAPDRYAEVVYEELVRDPAEVLGRTCTFLGVDYDPAMLSYADSTTYERPDPKLASQWRTKLSDEEVRLSEARIGPMLVERGYELSGLPPLRVSPMKERSLRIRDRLARIKGRMDVLGTRLFVEDWFSRRIGGPTWRTQVAQRVNQLDHARIK